MYAERNSRLLLGPASDRIHRLSPPKRTNRIAISRPKWTISRYGVSHKIVTTSHGITLSLYGVLEAPHTRRASPLLAGVHRDHSRLGQSSYPTRNFA